MILLCVMQIETKDLQPIADLVNQIYSGDPKGLINDIQHNIYMLHFLDHDTVDKDDVEWMAYVLKSISDSFQQVSTD